MAKVTYLIGAGASAKALPVVDNWGSKLWSFHKYLQDLPESCFSGEKKLFLERIGTLLEALNDHPTPDTYAKKLFLKERHSNDSNDSNALKKSLISLKYLISCYFVYEHSILGQKREAKDKRYDAFFATLLDANNMRLRDEVSIVSWNYDYQFELSFEGFLDFNSSYHNLSIWPDPDFPEGKAEVKLVKLNGVAGLEYWPKASSEGLFYTEKPGSNREKPNFLKLIKSYSSWFDGQRLIEPFIKFAWEDDPISKKAIEYAKSIMTETEVLVIIGYSFPNFNRDVDKLLLDQLDGYSTLQKIYYQAPSDNIKRLVRRLKGLLNNDFHKLIEDFDETEQFLIPFEL